MEPFATIDNLNARRSRSGASGTSWQRWRDMTSSKANLVRYVPSSSREPYRRVMNSEQLQAHLTAKAREVAERARTEGLERLLKRR